MADLETLDSILGNIAESSDLQEVWVGKSSDTIDADNGKAQMSTLPLSTRMRMAADDDQLERPKYYHLDDVLRMSYDDIMSKQTDTQLAFKRKAEAGTTSEVGEIIRATTENYITNFLNKPERAVLSIGNYLSQFDGKVGTVGQQWANWANEAINDYLDRNMTSQRAGDMETWAAKITGGVLSAAEYMATGVISSPLANISMGVDILGQATKNDIDKYIAETGDTALTNYHADLKDVAINVLNVGAQLLIEDKLGFGRVLKLKTAGADEFLSGFAQEFFQGTLEDIAESAKGNQEWKEVWNGMVSNIKDGVVGALLQGSLGLAAHHHYTSVAENGMKDFFVKNGMDEKAAAQKAHDMRIRMEKEIAPLLVKTDKDLYDLVMQKGATWGTTYDVAYNALKATDTTGMTEEQIQNRATELANQVATTVIQSVIKDGTDISEAQIIFNPADNTIYVNDKKSLNVKQALQEIQELDAEPATKKEVKQAIAEEKKAEQKKVTDTTKPVSAVDPKAPFNKTKEKSPVFKQMQKGIDDGSIKLNKTEQTRYAMLLRDKLDNKPTTNAQMDNFAEKMVQKYMPSIEIAGQAVSQTMGVAPQVSVQPIAQPSEQTTAKPKEQDRSRWKEGEKERKQVKRLEEDTGVDLSQYKKDSPERIKAEQEEALRLIRKNGVEYAEKVLKGEIKTDIIDGAWAMAIDTLASEGNTEAALLLNSTEFGNKIVALSESARQVVAWKDMLKETSVSALDAKKALETNITKVVGEEKAKKNVNTMKASLKAAISQFFNSKELEQKADSFLDSKVC